MYITFYISKKWVKTTELFIKSGKNSEWSTREAYEVKAPLFTTSVTGTYSEKGLKDMNNKKQCYFPYSINSLVVLNYLLFVLCFSALWIAAAFYGNILHLSSPLVFMNIHSGKGCQRCKRGKQTCCVCVRNNTKQMAELTK